MRRQVFLLFLSGFVIFSSFAAQRFSVAESMPPAIEKSFFSRDRVFVQSPRGEEPTSTSKETASPFDFGAAIGVRLAALDGFQFSGAFRFMPELTARAGFSFIPRISTSMDFHLGEDDIPSSQEGSLLNALYIRGTSSISSFQGHFLLDYHPFKSSSFRFTGGFYLGSHRFNAGIAILDSKTHQPITWDNEIFDKDGNNTITILDPNYPEDKIVVKPGSDLSLEVGANLGRFFKPYLGFGGGYNVPQTPVSFVWDCGVIFSGTPRLYSPNVIEGDINTLLEYSSEARKAISYMQILPHVSVGVSVRLF